MIPTPPVDYSKIPDFPHEDDESDEGVDTAADRRGLKLFGIRPSTKFRKYKTVEIEKHIHGEGVDQNERIDSNRVHRAFFKEDIPQ